MSYIYYYKWLNYYVRMTKTSFGSRKRVLYALFSGLFALVALTHSVGGAECGRHSKPHEKRV